MIATPWWPLKMMILDKDIIIGHGIHEFVIKNQRGGSISGIITDS